MNRKTRDILMQILDDMDSFAAMKDLKYPPLYLLGGSGCIIAGYLDRATTDMDLLDMDYTAGIGRLFRILEKYDLLDLYLTTIPEDFKKRAVKIEGYHNIYVLSREDIILSKVGRYSEKDIEDISIMMADSDKNLLREMIAAVLNRENISPRIKNVFIQNLSLFRERYDV
ncbi:MAG: DUF6036 family nucleotidyltransferase [Eubacteriales bacterium]|nr:DUF6036 family nucleotidyltransferase [Eubacteriales bacterium]